MEAIKPYWQDEERGLIIYNNPNADILPMIESVDIVLTDPPFGIGFVYAESKDNSVGYFDRILEPILSVNTNAFAIFQSVNTIRHWHEWFPEFNLISICKKWTQLNRNFLPKATDFVIWWGNENINPKKWQPKDARNWFVSNTQVVRTGPERNHPCPRPLDAMKYLIRCLCPPGSLILDPYLGSGTTLVAAKQLGHPAIGIEVNLEYCQIAVLRLQNTPVLPFHKQINQKVLQLDAFTTT